MNTKDIEEKTPDEQIEEIIDALVADVHYEKTWPAHTEYYQIDLNQFQEKLRSVLTQHRQAEVERAVEEERERIRVFVANNYRIDYANPAIDLEVIMGELEPLPKPNTTSDK